MTKSSSTIYPYELFTGLDAEAVLLHSNKVLKAGWLRRNYPAVELTKSIPWKYTLVGQRSWNFHIHCLEMLDSLLSTFDRTKELKYLQPALQVALDWVARHPRSATDVSDMAWYDMAVGMRAYRLAFIYQAACLAGILEPQGRKDLWSALEEHRVELADASKIKFHNNHGYYQVAGQMALGRRFADVSTEMKSLYEQGRERFAHMLDVQFTDEGVHREHSPDYHRMVLDTLKGIIRSGLISDEALLARALSIEESLSWFVYPSGVLVNFGDSDSRSMMRSKAAAVRKWDEPMMQAVSSGGLMGGARPSGLKVFLHSGYVIVRSPDPAAPHDVAGDSYLGQTAAFHSRTHKHADDLSFVWYDRGQPIIVDAGRYGYIGPTTKGSELWQEGHWYSDPMRIFMESTRAHNTLEFDGQNFRRKGVKPYGSAIFGALDVDGTFAIETRCKHFNSIKHDRVLVFRPREWLVVFDVFVDNLRADHDVLQWFHLAPGHHIVISNSGYDATLSNGETPLKIASLLRGAEPIPVVKGQELPVSQGWWSGKEREALPAPAFAFRRCGETMGVFATLFTFSGTLRRDFEGSRSNVTGRRSRLRWRDDRGEHQLSISREAKLSILYDFG